MADTNWVNTPEPDVTLDTAAPAGGAIAQGTFLKGSPASDYGLDVKFTSHGTAATGPVSVYVGQAGVAEFTADNLSNLVLIGTHTPVSATATPQTAKRMSVAKAFSGQIPDEVLVVVLNDTHATTAITALTVTPVRGHYATA